MKWSKRTLPIIFDDHMHPKTFRVKIAEYVNNLLGESKKSMEEPSVAGEEGQILQSNGDGTASWIDPEYLEEPSVAGEEGQILQSNGDGTTSWIDPEVLKNETVNITLKPGVFYSDQHIYAKRYGNVILLYGSPKFEYGVGGSWTTVAYLPEGMNFLDSQFFCDAGGSGNINCIRNEIRMRNYASSGTIVYFSALALLADSV